MGVVASIDWDFSTTDGPVRLWHGTEASCGESLKTDGVSAAKILEIGARFDYGAFEFCVTTSPKIAISYADMNSIVRMENGVPVVVSFDLPADTIREMLMSDPALAVEDLMDRAFKFHPDGFPLLNKVITKMSVTAVSEIVIFEG